MDQIREKILETIESLTSKRDLLKSYKSHYVDLKFKLFDYEQYQETDTPEIEVSLTSKAKVKARVVNPQRILVSLGCEYFVERDPAKASVQVEKKLKFLSKTIEEFDVKIREAKRTLENMKTLEDMEEKKKQSKQEGTELPETADNEEGLPFMDIREELDEDGNVVDSRLEPHNESRLKEFSDTHGIKIVNDEDDDDNEDEINQLLRDMEITPKQKKIEEIKEPLEEENSNDAHSDEDNFSDNHRDSVITSKSNNINTNTNDAVLDQIVEREPVFESAVSDIIEREDENEPESEAAVSDVFEREVEMPAVSDILEREPVEEEVAVQKTVREPQSDKPSVSTEENNNKYFTLLQELGISNTHTKPTSRSTDTSSTTSIKEESKSKSILKAPTNIDDPVIQKTGEEPTANVSIDELTQKYPPDRPALDESDILHLQLISDELDEDNEFEHGELGEDDYDYDEADIQASLDFYNSQFEGNDTDEDDDGGYKDWDEVDDEDADDDETATIEPEGIIPADYRDLFAKELERVRQEKNIKGPKIESIEIISGESHINDTVEPESKTEKQIQKLEAPSVISSKKQEKKKKKKSVQFNDELQVKEIENVSEQLKQISTSKLSKFKQNRQSINLGGVKYSTPFTNNTYVANLNDTVGDIIEKDELVETPVSDIVEKEEPVQDIVEKDEPVNDIVERQDPVSDIIEKEQPVNDIIEREQPVNDIIEKEALVGEIIENNTLERSSVSYTEESTRPQKISRFKSLSKQSSQHKTTPAAKISVPKDEVEEVKPEVDLDNIIAYVQGDEDEEDAQLLNVITDNISVYRGENEEEIDISEDEEDKGIMLVDEIVENEDVDDPDYFVDDNILLQEYKNARKVMMEKYLTDEEKKEIEERRNTVSVMHKKDEGEEYEPIDEFGNPVKESRFRKSLAK